MTYDEKKHDWLVDNHKGKEVIRYKNKVVFKKDDKLHNLSGASIKYNTDDIDEYHINGIKYTFDEWNFKMRRRKINRLLKITKKKSEDN